jgi:hypothetical protein
MKGSKGHYILGKCRRLERNKQGNRKIRNAELCCEGEGYRESQRTKTSRNGAVMGAVGTWEYNEN